MDVIKVEGGAKLHGTVHVEGAKNSALKLMAATVMAPGVYHLSNVPDISDVRLMCKVLQTLGACVVHGEHELIIDTKTVSNWVTPYEYVSKMRASISILGPLITRFGKAIVAMPGGCNIGARSIDQHLSGLAALGVKIDNDHGNIRADGTAGLHGAIVTLDFPSVGATENIMMGAVKAKGTTIIENAAREPEIVDLANMLNDMGAKIIDAGSHVVRIEGVEELHAADHVTVGDRIEAGTFIVAGALCSDEGVTVTGFDPMHLDIPLAKMAQMGVEIERFENGVTVRRGERLVPVDIQTLPYPGFPTDIQSPFMTFLTTVHGQSIVRETVFENRFMHVVELNRMGADITTESREAFVPGGKKLHGAKVRATDLRAGAAMVLAGLVATGTTEVSEIYHIERGYENFVQKFKGIGGDLMRVEED